MRRAGALGVRGAQRPRYIEFRRRVWGWTKTRERPLPWRGERDPYRVLVSEVMLQQTQAHRVVDPYLAFLERFPDVAALANAEPADVLRAWGSLGYNRRALNLWRAARAVVERGGFPRDVASLQELPGVGPYTARAVATFAFGAHAGVVDANVRRVVVRAFGALDAQDVADYLVPRGSAARWNQAMIDLGAEVCRARNPRCDVCPVRALCVWDGTQVEREKAPRFETTMRYARGRIVDALRREALGIDGLVRLTGLERGRVADAVGALSRDELIHPRGRRFALGPSARGSGVLRRR